jgi:hypothetical protein
MVARDRRGLNRVAGFGLNGVVFSVSDSQRVMIGR